MPETNAAITITVIVPTTTPRIVRNERSLCCQSVSNAIKMFSRKSLVVMTVPLVDRYPPRRSEETKIRCYLTIFFFHHFSPLLRFFVSSLLRGGVFSGPVSPKRRLFPLPDVPGLRLADGRAFIGFGSLPILGSPFKISSQALIACSSKSAVAAGSTNHGDLPILFSSYDRAEENSSARLSKASGVVAIQTPFSSGS